MMKCWVFDVDGTLSDPSHRRHYVTQKPKRWDLWNKGMVDDKFNKDVGQFVNFAEDSGHFVVVCTGREECYRSVTLNWLNSNGVYPHALYMRNNKDYRADDIVKRELLQKMREEGYEPVLVFDDRDRCVKLWRDEGIRCFQVNFGDF